MAGLRFLCVLLLSTMLLVSGCGGNDSKSSDSKSNAKSTSKPAASSSSTSGASADTTKSAASNAPSSATPIKETTKVSLAFGGGKTTMVYLPSVLAEYTDYYKEEGLEVEMIDMKGGAQAAQALVSGEVMFGSLAAEHTIKARAQGADLVMVSLYTRYPGLTLVVDSRLKDKVKTVTDLKGMKVGVSSPGSGTHKMVLSLMEKFGMQPSDIEFLGVGTSGAQAAMESDKIQAAVTTDPWITEMVTSGKVYVLWDLRTKKDTESLYGSDYPHVGLVTRREVLEKNPELVARVVRAVVRASKFIAANSPEAISAKIPAEIKGPNDPLYVASLKATKDAFTPDGLTTEKSLKVVIDSLKKDKVIPDNADIKPEMVFDGKFASQS